MALISKILSNLEKNYWTRHFRAHFGLFLQYSRCYQIHALCSHVCTMLSIFALCSNESIVEESIMHFFARCSQFLHYALNFCTMLSLFAFCFNFNQFTWNLALRGNFWRWFQKFCQIWKKNYYKPFLGPFWSVSLIFNQFAWNLVLRGNFWR